MTARVTWRPSGIPPIVEIGAGDEEEAGFEAFRRHALSCLSEGFCPWCGSRLAATGQSNRYGPKFDCGPCRATVGLGELDGAPAVGAYRPPGLPAMPHPLIVRRREW